MLGIDASVATAAIDALTQWTHLALDAASAIVIGLGGIQALVTLPKAMRGQRRFTEVRLDFARYLAIALEFQLASDVLETAISPSWDQLGILAAVATIRTALNFFLAREMKEERTLVTDDGARSSTGIVFELFDARGEFRAICGGGRYDNLLNSLGGVDLPALGFGMGDVVLGELLKARGLNVAIAEPDFWVAAAEDGDLRDVILATTQLRRAGASVEYALRPQSLGKQRKAAFSAGATYFLTVAPDFAEHQTVQVDEVQHVEGAGGSLVERLAPMPKTLASVISIIRDSKSLIGSAI